MSNFYLILKSGQSIAPDFSSILKREYHRWPAGSDGGVGGQFAPKGARGSVIGKYSGSEVKQTPIHENKPEADERVSKEILGTIKNHPPVSDQHGAADLTERLVDLHKEEILRIIDGVGEGGRPMALLHKGDLDKGIPTVWALGWGKETGTDIHDHVDSEVGITVARGIVIDRAFIPADRANIRHESQEEGGMDVRLNERHLRAGSTISIPSPYIHEVFGLSDEGDGRDVTVHAYWPPLVKMTYFKKSEKGTLLYDGEWDENGPPDDTVRKQEFVYKCGCGGHARVFRWVKRNDD